MRTSHVIPALLVAATAFVTGCGTDPIVGVLLPTSGAASDYGESIESGIRVALAEAREKDTLPMGFQVLWADSASSPETAVEQFRHLVGTQKAKIVIGGATSDIARALLPVLEETDTVLVSPSASAPDLTKRSRLFYRVFPSDALEGSRAGNFLYENLNQTSVLLYAGATEYVRGIEPEFRHQYETNLGGEIRGRIDLTTSDWREQSAEALLANDPDAVYIIGYANDTLDVLRHLREQNFAGRILTTSAFYSGEVLSEAGELAEGVLFPLPPFDRTDEDETVQAFVKRYMDTYQRAPDVFAAHGYDAMRLVIGVMGIAKPPETPEIKKALQFGLGEFPGVTGPLMFDDYGDVKHYPKMFIVTGGQVITYQRFLKAERDKLLADVQRLLRSR